MVIVAAWTGREVVQPGLRWSGGGVVVVVGVGMESLSCWYDILYVDMYVSMRRRSMI